MRYVWVLGFDGVAPDATAERRRALLQSNFAKLQATVGPVLDERLSSNLWHAVGELIEFGYLAGCGERTISMEADLKSALDESMRRLDAGG